LTEVFAETGRLILRALDRNELPRLVQLLDVWDVARRLAVLPYPYTRKDAEEFYSDAEQAMMRGDPQFYAIAKKEDGLLIGGIGMHPPRGTTAASGEVEIGYWLGKDFWGQGCIIEATRSVVSSSFSHPTTQALVATTAANNKASQNVLQKLGLKNMGLIRRDYPALRGDDHVLKWKMMRPEWQGAYCS